MSFLTTHPLLIALLLGWLLDLIFGDPIHLPHPIVWFGKWISFGEKKLNKGKARKTKGALFAIISILLTFYLTQTFLSSLSLLPSTIAPYLNILFQAALIFYCLAGHTLRHEVRRVFQALDRSLDEGRKQVSRIVGRDTQHLTANEVRTAALETLSENLSDGVIAPLFWLCLLGVPGMLTYKMVNTLDSMIGYHHPRYKDFGCWAAHIDDIANYIPARLTAFAMLLIGWLYTKLPTSHTSHRPSFLQLIRFVTTFGPQHASPNSGFPEASLAALLNCRFGGSHNYFNVIFHKPYIGINPRPLTTHDMHFSVRVCFLTECLCIITFLVIIYLI